MSAFDYIKEQRQKLDKLFPKILHAKTADEQEDLFVRSRNMMMRHMVNEEKNFYKMLVLKNPALKNRIIDARNEHDIIRKLLVQLGNNLGYEEWIFTLGELKQAILQHIGVEEGIFSLALKSLKSREFSKLVKQMRVADQKVCTELLDIWG